jgi:hypothetical protein
VREFQYAISTAVENRLTLSFRNGTIRASSPLKLELTDFRANRKKLTLHEHDNVSEAVIFREQWFIRR